MVQYASSLEEALAMKGPDGKALRVYVAYTRVSSIDQTCDLQRSAIERYCFSLEPDIVVVFVTETRTTKKTRPLKERTLRQGIEGIIQGIIIWRMDRWARTTGEFAMDMERLPLKTGFIYISITDLQKVDYTTAFGKLMVNLLSSFAQFERDSNSERTQESLATMKARGVRLGRPPGAKDKKKRSNDGYLERYRK